MPTDHTNNNNRRYIALKNICVIDNRTHIDSAPAIIVFKSKPMFAATVVLQITIAIGRVRRMCYRVNGAYLWWREYQPFVRVLEQHTEPENPNKPCKMADMAGP